jgi:ADP-heptose:LPS heptosyltransferase
VPILASLRAALPDAHIDWVVQDEYVDAVAAHPALDEAIPFPRRRFGRWWRRGVAIEMRDWFRALRRRKYDLVLDLQGLGRSGLIAWATRAPRRVAARGARELAWLGATVRHRVDPALHAVDAMLALVAAEGIAPVVDMRLHAPESDRAWWQAQRDANDLREPYAVLAPTARWPSKRWPVERWGQLVPALAERGAARIVLIGGPGERGQLAGLAESVAADRRGMILDLVGATGVGRMLAVIEDAAVVVATDSAPLHVAVGFDRPCVAIFGPTDPARVGPYRRPEAVVRVVRPGDPPVAAYRRMGDEMMRRVGADLVIERIDAVMGAAQAPAVRSGGGAA